MNNIKIIPDNELSLLIDFIAKSELLILEEHGHYIVDNMYTILIEKLVDADKKNKVLKLLINTNKYTIIRVKELLGKKINNCEIEGHTLKQHIDYILAAKGS